MRWNPFKRRRRGESEWLGNRAPPPAPAGRGARLAVAGGVCLAVVVLLDLFHYFHFTHNRQFVLHDLRVVGGTTMNDKHVREYLKLREGMPLFDLDIERRRLDLLHDAPNIRSLTIVRQLPATMEVRIAEREPVGRVGREGNVIDAEGVIFPRYVGVDHLPLLTGLEGFDVSLGAHVEGLGLAAVRLLAVLARGEPALGVAQVDLSHRDYLLLVLADQRQVMLWWAGMTDAGGEQAAAMRLRLNRLTRAMAVAPQRRMWDATVPEANRIFSPY